MRHADPKGTAANSKDGTDEQYDNKEDARVVKGSEQKTSVLLGETKEGQVTREDHKAKKVFYTHDPMSNQKAPETEYMKPRAR